MPLAHSCPSFSTLRRTMDRFPSEIFGLIFLFCPTGPFPKLDPINKPERIAILNVCQRWREIALSTPSLWTYIQFHEYIQCPSADTVAQFLLLSGSCSLIMTMHHSSYPCSPARRLSSSRTSNPALHLILAEMYRYERAYLHLLWKKYLPIEEKAQASRLVDLRLCCEMQPNPPMTDTVLTFPNLRRLQFSGEMSPKFPSLSSPKLTCLVFHRTATTDLEGIHRLIAGCATTLCFLEFWSSYIGEKGSASRFSDLLPFELPAIVRVFIWMKDYKLQTGGYFDYPLHIISQIKQGFHLDFRGLGLRKFMKRIRSKTVDRVVLTSLDYPNGKTPVGVSRQIMMLPEVERIRFFLDRFPSIKALHLIAFKDDFVTLVRRTVLETGRENSVLVSTSDPEPGMASSLQTPSPTFASISQD
jgi:hypothetical protein